MINFNLMIGGYILGVEIQFEVNIINITKSTRTLAIETKKPWSVLTSLAWSDTYDGRLVFLLKWEKEGSGVVNTCYEK